MRLFFLIFLCFPAAYSRELLDTKPVVNKLTDSTSLYLFTAGTIFTLSAKPYDERIREDWKNHQQMSPASADIGDFLGSGIVGVLVVGGQYFFDTREESWKSHMRSLIWETSAVFLMKYSFARKRPGSENAQSFPSGHTAAAFATATNLTYTYGWRAAVLSYPLAMFVGASRWADDMHWGSDVVAGAFVGIILARACTEDADSAGAGTPARLTPIISPDYSGLNYSYSF